MENVLNGVNKRCVSLVDTEVKRNNIILERVVDSIIGELKTIPIFDALFEKIFYGGSYYDGLKVGHSDEFDLDMLFVLPKCIVPKVVASDRLGFVHITAEQWECLDPKFKDLEKFYDLPTKKLSAGQTLRFLEGLITKSFNKLCPNGAPLLEVELAEKLYSVTVKFRKSGPAFNVIIRASTEGNNIEIDVDLVPCFKFDKNNWPSKSKGYRQYNSSTYGSEDTFLAVPKMPANATNSDLYWRLSFQCQERHFISGHKLGRLKPALRLIKKFRDCHNHNIASYYIKTVFMWEAERQEEAFWNKPLVHVFNEVLKIYCAKLKSGCIEYYWNEKYNLISDFAQVTLNGIANRIKKLQAEMDRVGNENPFVVMKFFVLSKEEQKIIQSEMNIEVKKKSLSTNNADEVNYETMLTKLKSDETFKKLVEDIVDVRLNDVMMTVKVRATQSVVDSHKFLLDLVQKNHELTEEVKRLKEENKQLTKNLFKAYEFPHQIEE